jgi:hypothetical protein
MPSTDLITHTLGSGHSLFLPTDSSTRLLELLVLTDQHWAFSKRRAPICLIGKTSKELLTVVRSMMEWLGGTISKEDVGDPGAKRNQRRKDEDEALGALALRFKYVFEALIPYLPSSMHHLQVCRNFWITVRSAARDPLQNAEAHPCRPCLALARTLTYAFCRLCRRPG